MKPKYIILPFLILVASSMGGWLVWQAVQFVWFGHSDATVDRFVVAFTMTVLPAALSTYPGFWENE